MLSAADRYWFNKILSEVVIEIVIECNAISRSSNCKMQSAVDSNCKLQSAVDSNCKMLSAVDSNCKML